MRCSFMFNGDSVGMWDSATTVPAKGDVVYVKNCSYVVICRTWSTEDFVSLDLAGIDTGRQW